MRDSPEELLTPEEDGHYNDEASPVSPHDVDDDYSIELPDDFERRIFGVGVDSYNRMDWVRGLFRRYKRRRIDCFKALGAAWTCCDNIATHRDALREILANASQDELDAMMCEREREALADLPAEITIYRGCYMRARDGLSWTLNEQVARKHPFLNRYVRPGRPALLLKARVTKERCVLKLDRGEDEIICYKRPECRWNELLPQPDANHAR